MSSALRRGSGRLLLLTTLALTGCADRAADEGSDVSADAAEWRRTREFTFVGAREGTPLLVPIQFEAVDRGGGVRRTARASLVLGATWDRFLDETWADPEGVDPWRVLPRGPLRMSIGASGPQAIWYDDGTRRLRLDLGAPISQWQGDSQDRFRLREGKLQLATETLSGVVFEELDVVRQPMGLAAGSSRDVLVLSTLGDSARILLAHSDPPESNRSRDLAWTELNGAERSSQTAHVERREMQTLERARRDVPIRWSFRVPEAELVGEVRAVGLSAELGPERRGRRVVLVRYTVSGWVEWQGRRMRVVGLVQHAQV